MLKKSFLIISIVMLMGEVNASEILFLKYDKLITASDGSNDGNTTGYDLTSLNADYFGAIKTDRLLAKVPNFSINAVDKTSWGGGADTTSFFYKNLYWEDNEKNNRLLAYYSDVSLSRGTTLKFELSCGRIQKPESGNIYLYAYDNNVSRWIRVGSVVDMKTSKEGSETGYEMIRFKIDSQTETSGDHNFTLVNGNGENFYDKDGSIPPKTLLAFGESVNSEGNISKLNLLIDKEDKCGCLCDMKIKLTDARDQTGSALSAPLNGVKETSLLTFVDGWEAKVTHPEKGKRVYGNGDSKIDISKEGQRKRFVSEEDNTTSEAVDTYTYYSLFQIHLKNQAEAGIDLKSKNDTFKLTLNRAKYCAVDNVGLYTLVNDGTVHLKGYGFNYDPKSHNFVFEGNFQDHPLQINNSKVDWNQIVITVTGRDVICQGMWRISLEVTPSTPNIGTLKLLDVADATDWKMEGMEFIIPYLNTDIDYGTYIVMTNQSDKEAEVYMDVYGDARKNEGKAQNARYTNIFIGSIPKRSTRIFFPKDLNRAILSRFPSFKAYRYLGKFLVLTEDENNIFVAAFQKDKANGKRSVPVLTKSLQMDSDFTVKKGYEFHE